jgi:hypothetical protein
MFLSWCSQAQCETISRYWSRWPYGPAKAVALDVTNNLIFLGDGNVIRIFNDDADFTKRSQVSITTSTGIACVFLSSDYLYVARGTQGLRIIDISDADVPVKQGEYNSDVGVYGVYVSGNYAYLACGTEGLHVVDISDRANPSKVGSITLPGAWGIYTDY